MWRTLLSIAALTGCADQGASGRNGDEGADGQAGQDGLAGADGATGPTGSAGPTGATGPTGPTGPAGAAGQDASAAYRWLDATGAVVSSTPDLLHHDASGHVWVTDVETGAYVGGTLSTLYYESADCSGPAYVPTYFRPMQPFALPSAPTTWYVRPIGLASFPITTGSYELVDVVCSAVEVDAVVFPLDDCVPSSPITPPSSPWVGPLYTAP